MSGLNMIRVGTNVSQGVLAGRIYHNPSVCVDGNCNYMFVLKNIHSDHKIVTIRVSSETYNP